jgi:cell surface protein SprA
MNIHLTFYISLQQRLANDEVLAVAYQYTIGDKVYQVGEFGNDGIDATIVTGNALQIGLLSRKA